jgi:hypothetical protein
MLRLPLAVVAGLALVSVHGFAAAQEAPPPAPPSNVVTSPDGSVSVGRTPEAGVDVHAPTQSGTVHAYGCDRVDVDARTRAAAGPCPNAPAYAYPYPYPYPYPVYPAYAYPVYAPPRYAYYYPPRPQKPRPPPDPARSGALIASSLIFGVGTLAAGTAYLASAIDDDDCLLPEGCGRSEPSQAALYAMGALLTVPPSIPRYVVGEIGQGVLFTALRGGSFALGAMVDWEDDSYTMPVMLAFVIPLSLGIVDLATTPRRDPAELTKPHADSATSAVRLHALGPTVTRDRSGTLAPALAAAGSF